MFHMPILIVLCATGETTFDPFLLLVINDNIWSFLSFEILLYAFLYFQDLVTSCLVCSLVIFLSFYLLLLR